MKSVYLGNFHHAIISRKWNKIKKTLNRFFFSHGEFFHSAFMLVCASSFFSKVLFKRERGSEWGRVEGNSLYYYDIFKKMKWNREWRKVARNRKWFQMIRVRKGRKKSKLRNEYSAFYSISLWKLRLERKGAREWRKNRLLFTFLDLKRAHSSWLACEAHIIHK